MLKFYRVSNTETGQGLWYTLGGKFTGLIHDKFNFCTNHQLQMDFDPDIVGYLSAVPNLDDLWAWFSKEDILELQDYGYFIHEYEVTDCKWYEKFKHWIINQETSVIVKQIVLFNKK